MVKVIEEFDSVSIANASIQFKKKERKSQEQNWM